MQTIITFLLIFTVIVVFHEFGHFITAKRAGVLVREFSIGMGPKLLDKRIGETVYTIRLLPVGGYVQLAGAEEDEIPFKKGQTIYLHQKGDLKVDEIRLEAPLENEEWTAIQLEDCDLVDACQIKGYLPSSEEMDTFDLSRTAVIYDEEGLGRQIAPRERHIQSQSVWRQLLVNFAGPLNNFILAILIFTMFAFMNHGVVSNEAVIGAFTKDSVAKEAGMKIGDRVLEVNGQKVDNWEELAKSIRSTQTDKVDVIIERKEVKKQLSLTAKEVTEAGRKVRLIGIIPAKDNRLISKLAFGFKQTMMIVVMLVHTLMGFFTKGFHLNEMGGPVAMYAMTDQVTKVGFVAVLNFMAFISANLGVMNLLPIPALDGGKILLNFYQIVRGKPLEQKKQVYVTIIGAAFLLILMVLVTFNDIRRFF